MTMRLIEWGDDLLGRQVLYFDARLKDPGKPRIGMIVAPGAEKGCVDVLVMGRGSLDRDRHATFLGQNAILGLSIKDKPPGNSAFALLKDETSVLSTSEKPAGASVDNPAGTGNAVSARMLASFDASKREADGETGIELEEADMELDGTRTADLDPGETIQVDAPTPEQTKKPTHKKDPFEKPRAAAELLADYIRGVKLGKAAVVAITTNTTVELGLEMAGDVAYLIRASYSKGWTFKHIDKGGRMTIDAGIDPAVADIDIKTMVSMMHDLIVAAADAVMDAPGDQFKAASDAMKAKMKEIRTGEYIPG